MTKYCLLYITVLIIGGCAQLPHADVLQVDPELQAYLVRFEQASLAINNQPLTVTNLKMEFDASLTGNEIGFCEQDPRLPLVHISRPYWDRMPDSDREELVFHELGHCVLGLQHDDALVPDALDSSQYVPISIMKTYHFSGSFYENNRTEYLKQLFNKNYLPTINY